MEHELCDNLLVPDLNPRYYALFRFLSEFSDVWSLLPQISQNQAAASCRLVLLDLVLQLPNRSGTTILEAHLALQRLRVICYCPSLAGVRHICVCVREIARDCTRRAFERLLKLLASST